jgi:outer membrane protein OmpA-like peptidoglycan-associated protein
MNRREKLFLCFSILMVLNLQTIGQMKIAKKEMSLYNYSSAILALQKCVTSRDSAIRPDAAFMMAECYRKQNDPFTAKIWYSKAMEWGNKDPEILYYLAQTMRTLGEYGTARTLFLKYDSLSPHGKSGGIYAEYCDSSVIWTRTKECFEISDLTNLNSSQSEFGTTFYPGGILFASDRFVRKQEHKYDWTGNSYLKLYVSSLVNNDSSVKVYTDPEPFGLFKETNWHDGPASINRQNNLAFINRTLIYGDKGKKDGRLTRTHLLKLFSFSKKDGKWTGPNPFFLDNDEYSVGHPALSPDGDTLFFVSDMPGGFGGTDLYYCTMESGKWSAPENLGQGVNTTGDEMFPYYDKTGNLFFSSDGLPGLGGLDIFITYRSGSSWGRPKRLELPLNSSFDDFSLATEDGGNTGFFSSNRPGGMGSDDIYTFTRISASAPTQPPSPILLSGFVKEKTSKKPIPDATVFIFHTEKREVRILKTDKQGYFSAPVEKNNTYVVKAMKSGWFPDCLLTRTELSSQVGITSLPRDLLLDKLDPERKIVLKDIFYDFDKWDIREDAKPSLDQAVLIMLQNPVNIELGSHTDCRGSAEYNRILSQKRAEAAVSYIIGKGIDPSRITAKGYGEEQLMNNCNCLAGVKCTETEQQENRRTEIRITGIIDKEFMPKFDPDSYKSGDTLNEEQLPSGFFEKCITQ